MPPFAKKQAVEETSLTQLKLAAFGATPVNKDGTQLSGPELWWSNHYNWLKDNGYVLRPRYAPDWTPSWKGTKKSRLTCEDSRVAKVRRSNISGFGIGWLRIASTLPESWMAHVHRMALLSFSS